MNEIYDSVVVGGGPAGLAAALKLKEESLNVLLLDENEHLGGILPQCIHPGFGIHYFREELTGPEFAKKMIEKIKKCNVEYITEAHVMDIFNYSDLEKKVVFVHRQGMSEVWTKTVIYAGGAIERHRFEIGIMGDRVAGIYTAGEAQTLMDIYGILPGKEIIIVGSGDVGLIMARRFALEGAKVKAVIELMPYPGGLARNMVILKDFNIPLYLNHKVVEVKGRKRVEKVRVVKLDENLREIEGSDFWIEGDTLLISAGLIPRVKILKKMGAMIDHSTGGPVINEFFETTVPGVFAAGNSVIINDLVDYVAEQGEVAAEGAKNFIENNGIETKRWIKVVKGKNIRFVVPHYVSGERDVFLYARVKMPVENAKVILPEIGKVMRFPVLKPSEMLRIKVKRGELKNMEKMTVEVQQ